MPFSEADIARFRAETSGTRFVTHFNHAGGSLPPDSVLDVMTRYQQDEHRMGDYETMAVWADDIAAVYQQVGALIGADASEIALTESATSAWYKAFQAIDWQAGDVILTAQAAYGTNYLAFLYAREKWGVEFRIAPNTSEGEVDVEALEAMIDAKTRMIALTHMPTNSGLVNPAEEVGQIARAHNLLYLLDACQTVGQMPIDVQALGCDFLSATGRKFMRGPRGTGFLYVRASRLEELTVATPDISGHEWVSLDDYVPVAGARRFEHFEYSRANRLGLGEAARYFQAVGPERAWKRIQMLSAHLREILSAIPGITVHDEGKKLGGIVTFTHATLSPNELKTHLAQQRLNVSVAWLGSARLDLERRGLGQMVRASVHYYNTESELTQLVAAIAIQRGIFT